MRKDWFTKDWLKKEIEETRAEQAQIHVEKQAVVAEKLARRNLLIEVADVVIQLRVAAERLETALLEVMGEDEGPDDEQH